MLPRAQQKSRVPKVLVPGKIPGIQTESSSVSEDMSNATDISREQGVAGRIVGGQSV